MRQGIVIYLVPIAMQECTHQEQEGALWLMEVGNQHLDYLIGVTWRYDNLCAGMKCLQSVSVQVINNRLYCLHRRDTIHQVTILTLLVWIPLVDVQVLLAGIRIADEMNTHIVKALDGTHTRGSHCYYLALMLQEFFQTATMYHDILRVHLSPNSSRV